VPQKAEEGEEGADDGSGVPGAVTEYIVDMAASHGWPGGRSKVLEGGFKFDATEKVGHAKEGHNGQGASPDLKAH